MEREPIEQPQETPEQAEVNPEQKPAVQVLDLESCASLLKKNPAEILRQVQLISQKEIGGDDSGIIPPDEELLKKFEIGELSIVVMDDKITGYLWYDVAGKKADLYEIAVVPEQRGKHMGTNLMDGLIDKLRKSGVEKIEFTATTSENIENPSIHFFKNYFGKRAKAGDLKFEQSGTEDQSFEVNL